MDVRAIRRNARIMSAVASRAMSVTEMAEAAFCSRSAAHRFTVEQRGIHIYIAAWRDGIALYRAGNAPDLQKPAPLTTGEKFGRFYDRLKTERPDDYEDFLLRVRRNRQLARKPRRDIAATALFGPRSTA